MGMALRRRRAHRTLRVVFMMKCYLVVFPILGQCRAGCYTLRSDSRADHPILYNAMAVPGLPPGETVENRPLGRTVSGGGGTVRPSAVRVGGWGAVRVRGPCPSHLGATKRARRDAGLSERGSFRGALLPRRPVAVAVMAAVAALGLPTAALTTAAATALALRGPLLLHGLPLLSPFGRPLLLPLGAGLALLLGRGL